MNSSLNLSRDMSLSTSGRSVFGTCRSRRPTPACKDSGSASGSPSLLGVLLARHRPPISGTSFLGPAPLQHDHHDHHQQRRPASSVQAVPTPKQGFLVKMQRWLHQLWSASAEPTLRFRQYSHQRSDRLEDSFFHDISLLEAPDAYMPYARRMLSGAR